MRSGRKERRGEEPVSKHQIQRADAGRKPNLSQETKKENFKVSIQLTMSRIGDHTG